MKLKTNYIIFFNDSRYFFTGAVGHGIELAETLANSGHDWIVAVGGDGTINETVNGIMRSNNPKTHFSFLCAGSGGDFRKTFGLPRYLEDYMSLLKNPRKRVIDIAKVSYTHYGATESRYFANICSAGISALVCNELPKRNRHLPGDARYLISTILAFC